MRFVDRVSGLRFLCRLTKRWGAEWETCDYSLDDVRKAAPWLVIDPETPHQLIQSMAESMGGIILFDSEDEAWRIYYQTIGDDGPRPGYTNQYKGPARVYMCICDDRGHVQNENT